MFFYVTAREKPRTIHSHSSAEQRLSDTGASDTGQHQRWHRRNCGLVFFVVARRRQRCCCWHFVPAPLLSTNCGRLDGGNDDDVDAAVADAAPSTLPSSSDSSAAAAAFACALRATIPLRKALTARLNILCNCRV